MAIVGLEQHARAAAAALVLLSDMEARLIVTVDDERLPGGPFATFAGLFVADDLVVFSTDRPGYDRAVLGFRIGDGLPRELLPGDTGLQWLSVLDVTPGGRVLFHAFATAPDGRPVDGSYLLEADGRLERLPDDDAYGSPVAINDPGNILFRGYRTPSGGYQHTLLLTGPPADLPCLGAVPVPVERDVSAVSQPSDGGCAVDRRGRASRAALLLLFGGIGALLRFRRASPTGSEPEATEALSGRLRGDRVGRGGGRRGS